MSPVLKTSHRVLSPLVAILLLLLAVSTASASGIDDWMEWLSPHLRETNERISSIQSALEQLGTPVVGQTVPQFGYLHPRLKTPPPTSPWVQIDLGASHPIDLIALIPAQVDWQPLARPSHGFPKRFRVDVSEDPTFATFTPVAIYTDTDLLDPGIAPFTIRANQKSGRYVRLTVTKLAEEDGQFFYALGEFLVISGNRNLANNAAVSASSATRFPPRWALDYLVDGKSALGPPIRKELLPYDGLYSGPDPDGKAPWLMVDLGQLFPVDELRLHPIHARLGADIPGFSFPARMKVELSRDESFSDSIDLIPNSDIDIPNPGNNPITLRANGYVARFAKVTLIESSKMQKDRFGLSELEIYSGGQNVALGKEVSSTGDPAGMSKSWPLAQLVDGYTSYGKLMELSEWLEKWDQRRTNEYELTLLTQQRDSLRASTQKHLRILIASACGILVFGTVGIVSFSQITARRRRQSELQQLRTQFAHDLHDEIGSNLAAIGVMSEMAQNTPTTPDAENWEEVQRIAKESNDALREMLWVSGARQESGLELGEQLQKTSRRMLPDRAVNWTPERPSLPPDWSIEKRRQFFLFFKETLANIIRHSAASQVSIHIENQPRHLLLKIQDNGQGFSPDQQKGTGLLSLKNRAHSLGGSFQIRSEIGSGTTVELLVPNSHRKH